MLEEINKIFETNRTTLLEELKSFEKDLMCSLEELLNQETIQKEDIVKILSKYGKKKTSVVKKKTSVVKKKTSVVKKKKVTEDEEENDESKTCQYVITRKDRKGQECGNGPTEFHEEYSEYRCKVCMKKKAGGRGTISKGTSTTKKTVKKTNIELNVNAKKDLKKIEDKAKSKIDTISADDFVNSFRNTKTLPKKEDIVKDKQDEKVKSIEESLSNSEDEEEN